MHKKISVCILCVCTVIFSACGMLPDINISTNTSEATAPPPAPTEAPPTAAPPAAAADDGWAVYTNPEAGFRFSYPEGYDVLTDETSLYGWDNAVALLYDGGQSYDAVVQVWEGMEELEAAVPGRLPDMAIFEAGGKLISLFNITGIPEFDAIAATFTLIN